MNFDVLPEPQRRALDVALVRADPRDAVGHRRTLATAVGSLLSELASDAPVRGAVDGVQWLDAASAATLGFALCGHGARGSIRASVVDERVVEVMPVGELQLRRKHDEADRQS
jgi:hypothetical protein